MMTDLLTFSCMNVLLKGGDDVCHFLSIYFGLKLLFKMNCTRYLQYLA